MKTMTKSKCGGSGMCKSMPKAMIMTKKKPPTMDALTKSMRKSLVSNTSKAMQKAPYKKK